MISISGSVQRSFVFPADEITAFKYYADMNRTLNFLQHISILDRRQEGEYRVLYSTNELGIYSVRLVCDIQITSDPENGLLKIRPLNHPLIVKSKAGMY